MGSFGLKLFKAEWSESTLAATTAAIMTALNSLGIQVPEFFWLNPQTLQLAGRKVDAEGADLFNYAAFNSIKTQIDAYCEAQGITILALIYSFQQKPRV